MGAQFPRLREVVVVSYAENCTKRPGYQKQIPSYQLPSSNMGKKAHLEHHFTFLSALEIHLFPLPFPLIQRHGEGRKKYGIKSDLQHHLCLQFLRVPVSCLHFLVLFLSKMTTLSSKNMPIFVLFSILCLTP